MTERGRVITLVGGLCLLFALSQIQFLDDPYHWDSLYYVTASARELYLHPGQLVPKGPWDNGHPPLFFWMLAAAWWLAGPETWVSHLLVLAAAVGSLLLAFVLGRRLFGARAGLLGALFLAVNPIFFYHAGTVTVDIPLTAFTLAALLAALRGRWGLATLAGCAMALTRESAVLFLPAIAGAAWLLRERRERSGLAGPLVFMAAPVAALAAWFKIHQDLLGWWIYRDDSREVKHGLGDMLRTLPYELYARTLRPFLRGHGQWIGTLAVAVSLGADLFPRRRRAPERKAWILAGLAAAMVLPIGGATALMSIFLPRYLLPILPVFSVLAGWAVARAGRAMPLAAMAVIAALLAAHEGDFRPGWEDSRAFLGLIEVTRDAAEWLEENHPDARVLARWPLWQAICDPIYGYVDKPISVLNIGGHTGFGEYCPPGIFRPVPRRRADRLGADDFDLLWVFTPGELREGGEYAELAGRLDLRFVERIQRGSRSLYFYAPVRGDRSP